MRMVWYYTIHNQPIHHQKMSYKVTNAIQSIKTAGIVFAPFAIALIGEALKI